MARAFVPDPETGVLKRKTWYGASEREAREKMQAGLADYNSGAAVVRDGRELTLSQWYEVWLAGLQVRPRTRLRYIGSMVHALSVFGDRPLSRITPAGVSGLIRQLHRDGASTTRKGKPLKSRGANKVRAVLRTCLEEARRQGKVARNVAALARPVPEDDVEEMEILHPEPEVVARFLAMAAREPDGNLWIFSLATGTRLGEAQGLMWDDVTTRVKRAPGGETYQAVQAQIRREISRVEGRWLIEPPKTKRSRRTITLPAAAVEALYREKARQAELQLAAETWPAPFVGDSMTGELPATFAGFVFLAEHGRPRTPSTVTDRMKAAMKAMGLDPIRFHDLRHSAASWQLDAGVPLAEVSDTLGHSRKSTTLDFYTRAVREGRVAETMDRLLPMAK